MEIEVPDIIAAKQIGRRRISKKIRAAWGVLFFITALTYRLAFPAPTVACINDAYHNLTLPVNRALVQLAGPGFEGNSNPLTTFGQAFIGLGQVLMDLLLAILGVIWIFKVNNLRYLGAIAAFYLIRGTIFLNLQKFPYPDNLAWRSPGFFSVTVPYDHTRDFFFSGHCGGLTVVTSEFFVLSYKKIGIFSFLSLLYMANMLMTTQVHYSIDILAGVLFALWFYRNMRGVTVYLDKAFSLPFVGWNRMMECINRQENDVSATSSQGGSQNQDKIVQSKEQFDANAINKDVLVEQDVIE